MKQLLVKMAYWESSLCKNDKVLEDRFLKIENFDVVKENGKTFGRKI